MRVSNLIFALCLLQNSIALGGWILEQKSTSNRYESKITLHLDTNRYRMEMNKGEPHHFMMLLDGKKLYVCQFAQKTCSDDPLAGYGMVKKSGMVYTKYNVAPTGKSGNVLGHPCKEFKMEIEMTLKVMGTSQVTKTTSTQCHATNINLEMVMAALKPHYESIKPFFSIEAMAKEFIKHQALGPSLSGTTKSSDGEPIVYSTQSIKQTNIDPRIFQIPAGFKLLDGRQLASQRQAEYERAMKNMPKLTKEQEEMMKKMGIPIPNQK